MDDTLGTAQGLEPVLAEMTRYARERNFDRVEELWLHAVDKPDRLEQRLDAFVEVAERFREDERKRDRLGTLLELLLAALPRPDGETEIPPRPLLRIYWLLVYCFPEKAEHRAAFCDKYEQLHPLASPERAFYEVCAPSISLDAPGSLRRLEKLLRFHAGAYVYHSSGWGVGRIVAVDPFLKQVKVDLEGKRQHRISIDAVDSILEPLDPGSFRALKFEGGEALRGLRDQDPVRLLDLVFDTHGSPLALKEIRGHLVPDVVPADQWTRWWNRVKGMLRDTGMYRVHDRAPHHVEKLARAVSYEDELVGQYVRADWARARQIARQLAKSKSSPGWERIAQDLKRIVAEDGTSKGLEAALILEKVEGGREFPFLRGLLSGLSAQELLGLLASVPGIEDQRRAVASLPEIRPDWEDLAVQLLLGKKETLADAAWSTLGERAPARLDRVLRDVVASPKSAPDAFCLMITSWVEQPDRAGLAAIRDKSPRDLLVLVLDFLEHLHHLGDRHGKATTKSRVAKIQDSLLAGNAVIFRSGLEVMSLDDRREIHRRIVRNENIPPYGKGALLAILTEYEPSLEAAPKSRPWDDPKTIWVTAQGRARREAEFRELMEVKLPKNFEDVGRAAAFGDLSENAEYTAALEERDKLTKRATDMKDELHRVQVIDPAEVPSGEVGLGSRIRLRNRATGEEHDYSILGPWDGGPEEGVISYMSPLGRLFFGKGPGEVVEAQLPGGTEVYEILEVRSHFG